MVLLHSSLATFTWPLATLFTWNVHHLFVHIVPFPFPTSSENLTNQFDTHMQPSLALTTSIFHVTWQFLRPAWLLHRFSQNSLGHFTWPCHLTTHFTFHSTSLATACQSSMAFTKHLWKQHETRIDRPCLFIWKAQGSFQFHVEPQAATSNDFHK